MYVFLSNFIKYISLYAPKYWNSLPDELRTMSSFMSFKCRLHTYMVSL